MAGKVSRVTSSTATLERETKHCGGTLPSQHIEIESRVRYELDGSIHGNEAVFDGQLNDVLNLNLPLLKQGRKGILDAVLDWWKHEKARLSGRVPRERFIRKRDQCVAGDGQLEPYCQVAVWWLDQRIARMTP